MCFNDGLSVGSAGEDLNTSVLPALLALDDYKIFTLTSTNSPSNQEKLWKLKTMRTRRRSKLIFLHIEGMQGLRLEKLPFNLSGFKQEIINWGAEHCRLLKIILI